MNDQDYIRKAVELADGWILRDHNEWVRLVGFIERDWRIAVPPQHMLDALAAQLVRQVDVLSPHYNIYHLKWTEGKQDYRTELHGLPASHMSMVELLVRIDGPDRTMNTIRTIVDSGVLE